jgi:hypothetical protein
LLTVFVYGETQVLSSGDVAFQAWLDLWYADGPRARNKYKGIASRASANPVTPICETPAKTLSMMMRTTPTRSPHASLCEALLNQRGVDRYHTVLLGARDVVECRNTALWVVQRAALV